ncbi:MAG: hypothetical protein RIR26_2064 [Pseudomonadota bacterium]|jgi:hypothetical protein
MRSFALRLVGGLGLACVSVLIAQGDASADIRVFAGAGLANLTPKKTGAIVSDKVVSGIDFKGAAQLDVWSPPVIPGISIYAGPDLTVGTLTREYTVGTAVVKETLKTKSAGAEVGVHFGLIPIVTLQAGFNYAFPLGGEWEVDSLVAKKTYTASSGSQTGVNLRALITPFPLIRVGIEYGMGSGKAKFKDFSDELSFNSSAVRALVGVAL